ncbi:MAG: alkaline phosphatase family protein, partial [Candidatus Coatesbacteria bacterium]
LFGVGGMDADMLERLMAEGRLPTFAALAARGTFAPLATTTPAEAEVAWATLATGKLPARHGLFGRFGRDVGTYRPYVADVELQAGRYLGSWAVVPPSCRSALAAEPLWRLAALRGIATLALWAPGEFPASEEVPGSSFLAGGTVPDASLGARAYYYFCTDADFPDRETLAGGVWRRIERHGGGGRVELPPPRYLAGRPAELTFEPVSPVELNLRLGHQQQFVRARTFSDYFAIPAGAATFVGRFYVVSAAPEIRVWLEPLDLDPRAPLFEVAAPRRFGRELAAEGPYGTRGRPLAVAALHDRVLGPAALVAQFLLRAEERRRLGLRAWHRHRPDLFLHFDCGLNDLAQIFWRHYDPDHPYFRGERFYSYADALEAAYVYLDATVGKFLAGPGGEEAAVLVTSAHGQRPWRRSFDLNRWLWENGYLALGGQAKPWGIDAPSPEAALARGRYRPAIAWEATRASAQGFGQIYLNAAGRERRGVVPPGDVVSLKKELRARLLAVRDGGRQPVAAVDDGAELFAAEPRAGAPDLVVSLAEGYRVSWESVLGGMAAQTFADNDGVVSGAHASVAAAAVPGVLVSNVKWEATAAGVQDLAPTIMDLLGVSGDFRFDGGPLARRD